MIHVISVIRLTGPLSVILPLYFIFLGMKIALGRSSGIVRALYQHYTLLYKTAPKYLSGDQLKDFTNQLNTLYIDNMKRVRDDLDWFIDKF